LSHSTTIPQGLIFNANNGYGQVINILTGPTGAPAPDFWVLVPWNKNGLGYSGLAPYTGMLGDQIYFPVNFEGADSNCQVPPGSTSTPPYMLPSRRNNDINHPYSVIMGYGGTVILFPYGSSKSAADLGIGATNDRGFGNCQPAWVSPDEKFAPAVALDLTPMFSMFRPPFTLNMP
jgi:hypothetical protein